MPRICSVHLLFLGAIACSVAEYSQAKDSGRENLILQDIWVQTGGAAWHHNEHWLVVDPANRIDECNWYGVTCDAQHTHVIVVDLSDNGLDNELPANLGVLTHLQRFDVSGNSISGHIPSLSGLTNLSAIDVGDNRLSGPIPALRGLRALQYFFPYNNQLIGSIPAMTGLTNLNAFDVDTNELSGPIPPLMTGLVGLNDFEVNGNRLTGSIPSLTGLTILNIFNVGSNQLAGVIPPLVGLVNLQYFDVDANQLTGSIPVLTGLANLHDFHVGGNRLSGAVPLPPPSLASASLCPNLLSTTTSSDPAVDLAWDRATALYPNAWWSAINSRGAILLRHGFEQEV